jgi:hypothetical protein
MWHPTFWTNTKRVHLLMMFHRLLDDAKNSVAENNYLVRHQSHIFPNQGPWSQVINRPLMLCYLGYPTNSTTHIIKP